MKTGVAISGLMILWITFLPLVGIGQVDIVGAETHSLPLSAQEKCKNIT